MMLQYIKIEDILNKKNSKEVNRRVYERSKTAVDKEITIVANIKDML